MSSIADVDRVMYECGMQVLHPGGLAKSDEMARACGVGEGRRVLDVGIGRGTTACHLAREYRCRVVGVDTSPFMVEAARRKAEEERVEDLVTFREASAYELPFEDGSFDVVLVECVTTLLDRTRAFPELVRVLKAGGRLGDLEMIYQKEPPEEFARILEEAWGGFTSMTLDGWKALFESQGLRVVGVDDFSALLADLGRETTRELGLRGSARLLWRLLLRRDLRRAMREYARIFKEGEGIFGYAYLVGERR
jgi:ubiquinone/menaquinone biosynthesis C-methylase UbiE